MKPWITKNLRPLKMKVFDAKIELPADSNFPMIVATPFLPRNHQ